MQKFVRKMEVGSGLGRAVKSSKETDVSPATVAIQEIPREGRTKVQVL